MQIRAATDADVPAIAAVVLAGASTEAPWTSFMPFRARKDTALIQHAEALARGYVEASDDTSVVMVVELSADESERGKPEIVAVSVWDTRAASGSAKQGTSLVYLIYMRATTHLCDGSVRITCNLFY